MPKRLTLQPHLSVEELAQCYRQAKDPIERSHYQIVWLLAQGKTTSFVQEVTGYSVNWIRILARRYNQLGPLALLDHRHQNPGGETLLNDVQQAQLWQALQGKAPDGGLWNGRKVADWISQLIDRPVDRHRGWEYLRAMTFRLRVPRPSHEKADVVEQEIWKKKLASLVANVQAEHPQATVELWTMDEHRLGLKPIVRRIWVELGQQPIANVNWRFQWLWLYGFVHPESGETKAWILPKVNIELFNRVLADFAQHFGVGKNKRIVLAMDQAGWHTSDLVIIPEGIYLEFMPCHSPELQPAERLWPMANEPIANESFETLDDLEEVLFQRCRALLEQQDLIRGLTCFHWWPLLAV